MITIKNLMNKIKWDKSENPQEYTFYYYDRIENKLKVLKWSSIISFEGLFIIIKKDSDTAHLPFHRIRKVIKGEKCIWKRYPLDGKKYYGEELHRPQKEFLLQLHKDEHVHKKISETKQQQILSGKYINPMLGKHHTEEVKKAHSIRMKRKYRSGEWIPHNKGKTKYNYLPLKNMSEKTIKEKNGNWKGGISRLPYSFDFNEELKNLIRKRDNFQCRCCNTPSKIVHHIDYNKQNSNPQNLIVLCKSCHSKTTYHKNKWTEYFNGIQTLCRN